MNIFISLTQLASLSITCLAIGFTIGLVCGVTMMKRATTIEEDDE